MKIPYVFVSLASLQCFLCHGLRDSELTTAVQELTMVLRGIRSDLSTNFDKLLTDLHQDRLARTEQTMALRDKTEDNRLGIEILRGQISSLMSTKGCPSNLEVLPTGSGPAAKAPEGSGGGGGGVGVGGAGGAGGGGGGGGRGIVVDSRMANGPHHRVLETHFHQEKGEDDTENPEQTPVIRECPSPFKRAGKHCLTILMEEAVWDAARRLCHSYAQLHVSRPSGLPKVTGDLVVPHDMEAFKKFIQDYEFSGKAWVGASTEGWGGMWAWIDGSLVKELPWLYSSPDQTGGLLAVDNMATFYPVLHKQALYPICELS
ncbi:uncharacterized protein LOC135220953 [Macrobrachium nipponense]|uniref:uncharacterized protein LOC135220953 n=1 Tax=Macrobrachium nipponense TaxID=159736 RepID=UPI0030C842FD